LDHEAAKGREGTRIREARIREARSARSAPAFAPFVVRGLRGPSRFRGPNPLYPRLCPPVLL